MNVACDERGSKMKWHFEPLASGNTTAQNDDDEGSLPGLLGIPAALLEFHGGRVLDPGSAVQVDGYPSPRHTVYRPRTLLVPGDLLEDSQFIADVNTVLHADGVMLRPAVADFDINDDEEDDEDDNSDEDGEDNETPDALRGNQDIIEALRRLPRTAVLSTVPGYARPADVDAWYALQLLRSATVPEDAATAAAAGVAVRPVLDKAKVDRIGLEHLLAGSATISGSPAGEWGGAIPGNSGSSGGDASGPDPTSSYLFSGGDSRTPVAILLPAPPRRDYSACASEFGRRPVVAVLDSGLRAHPWLDVSAAPGGRYKTVPGGFVAYDRKIQRAIRKNSKWAKSKGDKARRVIRNAWDDPVADNPLIGELNSGLGHFTFIAGIVRQVAPDARVLAVRVMHSDDIAYEGDILTALSQLALRIAYGKPVDVVSLSFGYFSESPKDKAQTSVLWQAIELLLSLGVVFTCAAGNYASSRRFYPAAFARQPVPADQVPVVSVGALNPVGTKAMFSNDGDWVTAWAVGAHVVSTYPTDIAGSRTPDLRTPVNRMAAGVWPPGREGLDPNDYSAGFAVWNGTSFSAPYAAALIANCLLEGAAKPESGLKLDGSAPGDSNRRAVAALSVLPLEIE
jgi:subtilisin family serine protease